MTIPKYNKYSLISNIKYDMREIWKSNTLHGLNEQAVPSYLHPVPIVAHIFWRRIQIIINEIEKDVPDTLLDFGCGVGTLFLFLHALKIPRIIAYDTDPRAAEGAQYVIQKHGIDTIKLISHPTQLAQVPSGSVDSITALDVLEHVEDLEAIVQEFERMLKPDGIVYISGPTENRLYRLMRKLGGKHYKEHFHVRNIYDIEHAVEKVFNIKMTKNLWPFVTFFKVVKAQKAGTSV